MTDGAELRDVVFGWRIWFSDGSGLFPLTKCRDFKSPAALTGVVPNESRPRTACNRLHLRALLPGKLVTRYIGFGLPSTTCGPAPPARSVSRLLRATSSAVAIWLAACRCCRGSRYSGPGCSTGFRTAAYTWPLSCERPRSALSSCSSPAPATPAPTSWLAAHGPAAIPDAERIAESLSAVLGLRTVIGLPRYSHHDWATRSDWCKPLGPQGICDPLDNMYISWFGDEEPVVAFTAPIPAPRETVAGEAVCRHILDTPGRKKLRFDKAFLYLNPRREFIYTYR